MNFGQTSVISVRKMNDESHGWKMSDTVRNERLLAGNARYSPAQQRLQSNGITMAGAADQTPCRVSPLATGRLPGPIHRGHLVQNGETVIAEWGKHVADSGQTAGAHGDDFRADTLRVSDEDGADDVDDESGDHQGPCYPEFEAQAWCEFEDEELLGEGGQIHGLVEVIEADVQGLDPLHDNWYGGQRKACKTRGEKTLWYTKI